MGEDARGGNLARVDCVGGLMTRGMAQILAERYLRQAVTPFRQVAADLRPHAGNAFRRLRSPDIGRTAQALAEVIQDQCGERMRGAPAGLVDWLARQPEVAGGGGGSP